jgi:hypothetical protein
MRKKLTVHFYKNRSNCSFFKYLKNKLFGKIFFFISHFFAFLTTFLIGKNFDFFNGILYDLYSMFNWELLFVINKYTEIIYCYREFVFHILIQIISNIRRKS